MEMKALRIANSANVALGLQNEIRRCEQSRYDHRLHAVLLVAKGMSCPHVARILGDSPRSIENWVRRFESEGLTGLQENRRGGRPPRLSPHQVAEVETILRNSPREAGMSCILWNGRTLAAWIERQYGVCLGVRQCQRLFQKMKFR